jgi:hypothetical protein
MRSPKLPNPSVGAEARQRKSALQFSLLRVEGSVVTVAELVAKYAQPEAAVRTAIRTVRNGCHNGAGTAAVTWALLERALGLVDGNPQR